MKDSFSSSAVLNFRCARKSMPYSAVNFSFWRSIKYTFIYHNSDSRCLLTAEARIYSQGFVVDKVDRIFSEYFGFPPVYVLSKMVAGRSVIQMGVLRLDDLWLSVSPVFRTCAQAGDRDRGC